jgi:diguanylate cyclase (GGDEF)-like protein
VHVQPDDRFAVLFMDFDRFKLVNDSLGHEAGDELLRQIAVRVKQTLRPGDDVARLADLGMAAAGCNVAGRLGGDEFIVLLEHIDHPSVATRVAQRLLDALAAPRLLGGRSVQSSASIGIVTSDISSASVESVLRDADTAMYEAKRRGRGRYVVFDRDASPHPARDGSRSRSTTALQQTPQDQLGVVYQPIVALGSQQPVGLEALATGSTRCGPVSPANSCRWPRNRLVDALGELVLPRLSHLAAWQRALGPAARRWP